MVYLLFLFISFKFVFYTLLHVNNFIKKIMHLLTLYYYKKLLIFSIHNHYTINNFLSFYQYFYVQFSNTFNLLFSCLFLDPFFTCCFLSFSQFVFAIYVNLKFHIINSKLFLFPIHSLTHFATYFLQHN